MPSIGGSMMRERPLSSQTSRRIPEAYALESGSARRTRAPSSWLTVQRSQADDDPLDIPDVVRGPSPADEADGLARQEPWSLTAQLRRAVEQVEVHAEPEHLSEAENATVSENAPEAGAAPGLTHRFEDVPESKCGAKDTKTEKDHTAMDHSAKAIDHPAASRSLRDAIRKARLEEAERLDEAADQREGELARLDLLNAELESVFAEIPNHDDRFNLALVPSRPARLWIDLFTYVTVEEGANAYLFMRNSENGRRTLFRSTNVAETADRITDYVAAQIVQRERLEAGLTHPGGPSRFVPEEDRPRVNTRMVIMSFIVGLLTGAVGLFAAVWLSAT